MNTAVDTLVTCSDAETSPIRTTKLDAKFRDYDSREVKRLLDERECGDRYNRSEITPLRHAESRVLPPNLLTDR